MNEMKLRAGRIAIAMVATAAVVAASCTGSPRSDDKAGGGPDQVVLKLADANPDLSAEPAVAYFVQRVSERSNGTLRIDVVPNWGTQPNQEQQIVRSVAAGDADLGAVGTRVFDTLGVNSFQALTAPMLIDSYPLEEAVISSGIPRQMLMRLPRIGVTGLAVLGDGLRKPIAVDRPLRGPADWRGITFATIPSRGEAEAIQTLDARAEDVPGGQLPEALANGDVQGLENNLLVYQLNQRQGLAPYVTANVNLWPRTMALLVDPDRLSKLTDEQRSALERAAADAATRSTALVAKEAGIVQSVCAGGARLVDASDADLAALRQAFAPVYATLEQDPQTKGFIDRIDALKRSTPSGPALDIPADCTGPALSLKIPPVGGDPSVLNGIYRIQWSEQDLIAAGASATFAHENHGIDTLTLTNGHFSIHFDQPPAPNCDGTYTVLEDRFWIDFYGSGECGGIVAANWSLGNDELQMRNVQATDAGDVSFWGSKSWTKIG